MCHQEKINIQKVVLTPCFYSLGYVISPRTEVVDGEGTMWISNIRRELDIAGMQILEEVVWVQLLNVFKFACHCCAVCAQPCHLRVFQNQARVRHLLRRSLSSSRPQLAKSNPSATKSRLSKVRTSRTTHVTPSAIGVPWLVEWISLTSLPLLFCGLILILLYLLMFVNEWM